MKKLSFLLAGLFVFGALNLSAQNADVQKVQKTAEGQKVEKADTHKGCCSASSSTKECLTYSKEVKAKKGEKLLLIKADVDCNNCKSKIEKQMSYAKGVKDVKADVTTKAVTIAYDPKKTDEAALLKEVQKLNMGGEIVRVKECSSNCSNH
ncbi:heavy-metal-associated domain-containing protein [Odoribacter sp. OttesenSCG-928-L07]|nr:heavy-metal-associated domain-containing protein [Odoribacter sp. OttesenSCG-928-L07]MDL2238608.1 heavy-metal-associated domain-containing protein [Bacteroidales bacterium OttesenSCG-928-L14]MDL2240514.1 heavy-metal-associated domain-containing protein [Bacteroidales bacterium OttesenSCG-928-K22]